MGSDHARILAQDVPGAELRYVCDADQTRAKAVADSFGAAHVASDPEKVIAAADVDAVLIASPDATHAPLTLAALAARKPVLCEKPLAPTSADCRTVLAAEAKLGRKLVHTGFMRRFDPAYVDMKQAFAAGAVGKALMFHCFHRNVSAPDWFTPEMAITNSAPHEFDIARWLLGEEPVSIAAFQPRAVDPARPGAPVLMVLETEGGKLVNIEVNVNAAYGYDVRGELVGETGSISLRQPATTDVNSGLQQQVAYPKDWRPRFAEAYRRQDQAWIASIASGRFAGADAWDGYAATRIAEAGVLALKSGRPMAISPGERP